MKVSYDTTIDELADEHMLVFGRLRTLRRTQIKGVILLGLVMVLGSVVLGSDPLPSRFVRGCVLASISIVIFLIIHKPLQRSRLCKIIREQLRTDEPIPFEIELTDSQIRTTQAGIETGLNWSSLESIEESADAIHFWFDHKGLVSVRNDAFASAQERGEFVSFARGRMGEAASSKDVSTNKHSD